MDIRTIKNPATKILMSKLAGPAEEVGFTTYKMITPDKRTDGCGSRRYLMITESVTMDGKGGIRFTTIRRSNHPGELRIDQWINFGNGETNSLPSCNFNINPLVAATLKGLI